MRLATISRDGRNQLGVVVGDEVVLLADRDPELPQEMSAFLAAGAAALARAQELAANDAARLPLAEVKLRPPLLRPPKFLAIGLNYSDHIEEQKATPPKYPIVFNKQSTCVSGPYDDLRLPALSEQLDYEGELGLVIGRRCRQVSKQDAKQVIAGYLVANDVSVRDWQMRTPTWTLGKSFDTHGPIGPWIVTTDEVGDPHRFEVRTWVNGELRQHSNTRNLFFNCYELVEYVSSVFTLEPGDIISTGTPGGVAAYMDPPRWLVPGDKVRIEIEGIGVIENQVVPEPVPAAPVSGE